MDFSRLDFVLCQTVIILRLQSGRSGAYTVARPRASAQTAAPHTETSHISLRSSSRPFCQTTKLDEMHPLLRTRGCSLSPLWLGKATSTVTRASPPACHERTTIRAAREQTQLVPNKARKFSVLPASSLVLRDTRSGRRLALVRSSPVTGV